MKKKYLVVLFAIHQLIHFTTFSWGSAFFPWWPTLTSPPKKKNYLKKCFAYVADKNITRKLFFYHIYIFFGLRKLSKHFRPPIFFLRSFFVRWVHRCKLFRVPSKGEPRLLRSLGSKILGSSSVTHSAIYTFITTLYKNIYFLVDGNFSESKKYYIVKFVLSFFVWHVFKTIFFGCTFFGGGVQLGCLGKNQDPSINEVAMS